MADKMHPRQIKRSAGNNRIALEFEVTLRTKPAETRCVVMSKKLAAVSSWGFSGYIAVLPKDEKPPAKTTKKDEPTPPQPRRDQTCG
jgi:hypothetical protein